MEVALFFEIQFNSFGGITLFKENYCTCEKRSTISEELNDQGHWSVCNDCNKVIEDTFEYFDINSDDYYG
ncbi:hypothetical protein UP12_12685 [Bacillus pumilus]|nr:hypothetical protein UP12_12685 [Bacillus pumilus]PAK33622.1 hypothetical protein CHI04_14355 [Bacillus safensis]